MANRSTDAPKNGYSIWSLLVITTMMAFVLAIPTSGFSSFGPGIRALLGSAHQLSLWSLVGTLIWMLSGKRRVVVILGLMVLIVAWGPLWAIVMEELVMGNRSRFSRATLKSLGLYDWYGLFYITLFKAFGYGPI